VVQRLPLPRPAGLPPPLTDLSQSIRRVTNLSPTLREDGHSSWRTNTLPPPPYAPAALTRAAPRALQVRRLNLDEGVVVECRMSESIPSDNLMDKWIQVFPPLLLQASACFCVTFVAGCAFSLDDLFSWDWRH